VHVHVDEAWHNVLLPGIDHRRAGRFHPLARFDRDDPVAVDDNRASRQDAIG
jgi:hypothetical protein